eukprot:1783872-Prymnesium_polylepis.1
MVMRDNDESTKHGSCMRYTTTARLSPRGTPSSPIPSAGMPWGRPDSPSAGTELAAKEPAMNADAAFALEQRPELDHAQHSPPPRARGLRP